MVLATKKPMTVHAMLWVGFTGIGRKDVPLLEDVRNFIAGAGGNPDDVFAKEDMLHIRNNGSDVLAHPGDYIIVGVKGEVYPCPNDVFTQTYNVQGSATAQLTFGDVIAGLKRGKRYARAGWNGKNMFVFLVPGSRFKVNREPLLSIMGEGTEVEYHGHIDMKTAQGYVVPWLASQADMLAEDWNEV